MGQKVRPQSHGYSYVKSQPVFKKNTRRFVGKFAVKLLIKIPLHLAYVATLSCETLLSRQAINDKLHGSVVTYLRHGKVVNNQITNGLLLSLSVKKV